MGIQHTYTVHLHTYMSTVRFDYCIFALKGQFFHESKYLDAWDSNFVLISCLKKMCTIWADLLDHGQDDHGTECIAELSEKKL